MVARQPVDRLRRLTAQGVPQRVRGAGRRRREPRRSASLPNGNANDISWSPDGTYIIFDTSQRTEEGEVVRVDLILRTPRFREDRFRDLFKDEPPRTGRRPAADRRRRPQSAAGARPATAAASRTAASRVATRRSRSKSSSTTSASASASARSASTSVAQSISPDGKIAAAHRERRPASRTSTSTRSTSCRASRPSRGS